MAVFQTLMSCLLSQWDFLRIIPNILMCPALNETRKHFYSESAFQEKNNTFIKYQFE